MIGAVDSDVIGSVTGVVSFDGHDMPIVNTAAVAAPRGDADSDGDVDLADLLEFVECLSTAGNAFGDGCAIFDFDQDRDVDFGDFIAFQSAFTGAR